MADVYMEVPAVKGMAKKFQEIGEVLRGVGKALDALGLMLKTTAFVGGVGIAAYGMVEQFNKVVNTAADNCQELSKDLEASATAFEQGDSQGATRFH